MLLQDGTALRATLRSPQGTSRMQQLEAKLTPVTSDQQQLQQQSVAYLDVVESEESGLLTFVAASDAVRTLLRTAGVYQLVITYQEAADEVS